MAGDESSAAVYLVIENAYGAVKYPDSIWRDEDDAVDRARELADGAEYTPKGHGFSMEGMAQKGPSIFEVREREVR